MVDKKDKEEGPDWPALYADWRAGEPMGRLAARAGLNAGYLTRRLQEAEKIIAGLGLIGEGSALARLTLELERAGSLLSSDDPAEAEKRAKALMAVARAAKCLEDLTPAEAVRRPPDRADEPSLAELRAELERRLHRLRAARLADDAERAGSGATPE